MNELSFDRLHHRDTDHKRLYHRDTDLKRGCIKKQKQRKKKKNKEKRGKRNKRYMDKKGKISYIFHKLHRKVSVGFV